jgi:hypothetical protein
VKFLMLESAWMHIPYTLHGILESEFQQLLFRRDLQRLGMYRYRLRM